MYLLLLSFISYPRTTDVNNIYLGLGLQEIQRLWMEVSASAKASLRPVDLRGITGIKLIALKYLVMAIEINDAKN